MIKNGNVEIQEVDGISDEAKNAIIHFLQGVVYGWCKNNQSEWFTLRELMGGKNRDWQGTPLEALYWKYDDMGNDKPEEAAGQDAGWLLKKVIHKDKRNFETEKTENGRKYREILVQNL